MEGVIGTIIASLFSAAATFGGAWLLFRGKKVDAGTEETKVEASATDAFLQGQRAFQEYVDDVVDERVAAAIAGLQAQVTELTASMAEMRRESHEMNDAIRARETQLWLWNIRNRPGPMPELAEAILKKLGITHLSASSANEGETP